jgi:hypothetical protein
VDGAEGYATLRQHPPLPVGPRVRTPSGGLHAWFASTEPLAGTVRFAPGLDTRCTGNLVVAPPSVGVRAYRWLTPPCRRTDLPPVPSWIAEGSQRPPRATASTTTGIRDGWAAAQWNMRATAPLDRLDGWLDDDCDELADTPEGERNNRLYALSFKWIGTALVHAELEPDDVIDRLTEAAECSGLTLHEIALTIASASDDAIESTEQEP